MNNVEKLAAEKLLKIKAIKLQPSNPFTWASGWKSPIYCDNRKIMSYPEIRNFIKIEFARIILEKYPNVEAIAGVATGAIAPGAIVADLCLGIYSYLGMDGDIFSDFNFRSDYGKGANANVLSDACAGMNISLR